jgi:hypothetical protein
MIDHRMRQESQANVGVHGLLARSKPFSPLRNRVPRHDRSTVLVPPMHPPFIFSQSLSASALAAVMMRFFAALRRNTRRTGAR